MSIVTPKKLNSKKSYSILPVGGGGYIDSHLSPSGDRKFSESTGLAKFSLSPNRSQRVHPKKSGLPVYIPVDNVQQTQPKPEVEDRDKLLQRYAEKQRKLLELQKQVEIVKFEMLEISSKLEGEAAKPGSPQRSNENAGITNLNLNLKNSNNDTNITFSSLKNKASTIFNLPPPPQPPIQDYLNKFQQQTEVPRGILKNIVNDVGKNLDENNIKIKQFINSNNTKTTKIFSEFMTNISPTRKQTTTPRDVLESSFMVDNLLFNEVDEDASFSSNIVDIDDLESVDDV